MAGTQFSLTLSLLVFLGSGLGGLLRYWLGAVLPSCLLHGGHPRDNSYNKSSATIAETSLAIELDIVLRGRVKRSDLSVAAALLDRCAWHFEDATRCYGRWCCVDRGLDVRLCRFSKATET